MAEISRPWNGTVTGDAGPYSDANWQQLYRAIIGFGAARNNNGVFLMSGTEPNDGLKVQAQAGPTTSVDVLIGAALVQGIAYFNTATTAFTPAANASGNPRIDTIILRADYALQTVRLAILQGTPAVTPAAPSLTQSAGVMWEIPIADLALANGFTSIAQSAISPRQDWVNAPPAVYSDHVLNNSGVTLNDGDVVIWDSTADRSVTTTTTAESDAIAGVWRGQTATGSYGRLQTKGIGYVNANAAITRGQLLVTSTTAKKAGVLATFRTQFARALETTAGSGLVLCEIDARLLSGYFMRAWTPFAYPVMFSPSAAIATDLSLPANGGSIAIPMNVTDYMAFRSVTIRNGDASLARTWGWDLYKEVNNADATADKTLTRVANSSADETFTAAGSSNRTITAASAPVILEPGVYWLVVQNRHATNTFNFRYTAAGLAMGTTAQTKTTTNPNGASLDFVAATWTALTDIFGARMNGSVFGQSAIF